MIDQTHTTKGVCATEFHRHFKCLSWTAIIAGALVGIGLAFLLNVFGMAIGLSALTTSKVGITTLAVGGFIGMLIGTIASMFFMGWISGFLARGCYHYSFCDRRVGALYGFLAWCLALIVAILFSAQVNSFVAHHYTSLSNPTSYIENAGSPRVITMAPAKNSTVSTTVTTVTDPNAAKNLAFSLFFTFFLFIVGAISSCFGGYYGLKSMSEECDKK